MPNNEFPVVRAVRPKSLVDPNTEFPNADPLVVQADQALAFLLSNRIYLIKQLRDLSEASLAEAKGFADALVAQVGAFAYGDDAPDDRTFRAKAQAAYSALLALMAHAHSSNDLAVMTDWELTTMQGNIVAARQSLHALEALAR